MQGIVTKDFTGKGTIKFANGDVYEGDFKNGLMEGQGVLRTVAGDEYMGQFKNGLKHVQ